MIYEDIFVPEFDTIYMKIFLVHSLTVNEDIFGPKFDMI